MGPAALAAPTASSEGERDDKPGEELFVGASGRLDLAEEGRGTEVHLDASSASLQRGWDSRWEETFQMVRDGEIEGRVGDYDLKVKVADPKVSVSPRVKPAFEDGKLQVDWKLKGKARLKVLQTELRKVEQDGEWTRTSGFRGGLEGTWRFGYGQDHGEELEAIDESEVVVRADAFRRWDRDLAGGAHLQIDTVAGAGHDLLSGNSEVHVTSQQRLTGDGLSLLGQSFGWVAEARQQVGYNTQEDEVTAGYQVYAGLKKDIPVRLLGRESVLRLEAGPRIKGDLEEPIDVGVASRVRLDF